MTIRTLEQAVLTALHMEPLIGAGHIAVTVNGGVATLSGYVESYSQKLAAKSKAESVSGVNSVVDELEVRAPGRPGQGADDIASSVLNALHWDFAIPRDRVSAKCEKGWVTLTGEVSRAYQKSCAEADVRKIRGVVGVTNDIKVFANAAARGDAVLRAHQIGAIADDRKTTASREALL